MSALESLTYYRLPRDDEGRLTHFHDRAITNALRWQPEMDEVTNQARSIMRRLREGDVISGSDLSLIGVYLGMAIVYYTAEPEPYPGRNAEAINDLFALRGLLEP